MSISAMKQALEALESWLRPSPSAMCLPAEIGTAMDTLRQAIAEAEDAVAAEREACAKVCESMDHDGVMIAADCAKAIRARGEK